MLIELSKIRTDGGTQLRQQINNQVLFEYAQLMKEGVKFPPVVVFHDGKDYWLADGFYRRNASAEAGIYEIEAEVHEGTCRDALLYSAGANATHGLPRTIADKRHCALLLLNDPEWGKWSTRQIARRCGLSKSFIAALRKSLSATDSDERTYTTKHGTEATMKTGKIGKGRKRIVTKEQYEAEARAEAGEQCQEDAPTQGPVSATDPQVPADQPAAAEPGGESVASVSLVWPKDIPLMAAELVNHLGIEFAGGLAEELARVVKERQA